MRIDCHQHFWAYNEAEFGWIDDTMAVLRRDFLPTDLKPELDAAGMGGCIAVQAPQSLAETEFLLSLKQANPWIVGIVGYLDVAGGLPGLDEFGPQLAGVRDNCQGMTADEMLAPGWLDGLRTLGRTGLPFDICIQHHQVEAATKMADACPNTVFVLDHLAKPPVREGHWQGWTGQMQELASRENVWCKLSCLPFEAEWATWTNTSLAPLLEVAIEAFGVGRCLYGSDWPVCLCAGTYERHVGLVESVLSESEQEQVFEINPAKAYRL